MGNGATCRVLFVEDSALVAMMVEDLLEDAGIEVVGPATTLAEALDLARNADIQAAILDINIGGLLVFPAADVLRERSIPVVFASGYSSSMLPERYRESLILHKPFGRRSFEEVLHAALANSDCEISAA